MKKLTMKDMLARAREEKRIAEEKALAPEGHEVVWKKGEGESQWRAHRKGDIELQEASKLE